MKRRNGGTGQKAKECSYSQCMPVRRLWDNQPSTKEFESVHCSRADRETFMTGFQHIKV